MDVKEEKDVQHVHLIKKKEKNYPPILQNVIYGPMILMAGVDIMLVMDNKQIPVQKYHHKIFGEKKKNQEEVVSLVKVEQNVQKDIVVALN